MHNAWPDPISRDQLDGAGYRSFIGAATPPGAGGALFDGFAPPSLDPDE